MGISRPCSAYAVAFPLLGVALLAYLTVGFVSRREQIAIDSAFGSLVGNWAVRNGGNRH
jgi:hypothetical protein